MLHNEFQTTCMKIKKNVNGIQRIVRQRHSQNLSRDRLTQEKYSKKQSEVRCLSKDKISVKRKSKCEKNKIKNKPRIALARQIGPNQNAINLSFLNLTLTQKSLLAKMPSFIPTPAYINWYEL